MSDLYLVENPENDDSWMPIIAIDGPAGAGKSTVARMIAYQFRMTLIDTGALYRTLALLAMENNISLSDEQALAKLCGDITFRFGDLVKDSSGIPQVKIYANDIDVTAQIRTPELGLAASNISKFKEVRDSLVNVQRNFASVGGVVMEGRDIGTVILPNAHLKFFLTASLESRAKRRFEEHKLAGRDITIEQVMKETQSRDEQDMGRDVSPLKQADDAIVVDSTNKTLREVVDTVADLVNEHIRNHPKKK